MFDFNTNCEFNDDKLKISKDEYIEKTRVILEKVNNLFIYTNKRK